MAFTSPMTAVTGATFTAAQFNTNVRDNLNAIWVGTTANDMEYYTSSTTKSRLAAGAIGSILNYDGSGVTWRSAERYIGPITLNSDIALTTGDQKGWFFIPVLLNGWNITYVAATRDGGGTGTPTIQLRNITDSVDVLSTKVTIDSGEVWSGTAAIPPVIDTTHDDVASGDRFAIDVDIAGINTLSAQFIVGFTHP